MWIIILEVHTAEETGCKAQLFKTFFSFFDQKLWSPVSPALTPWAVNVPQRTGRFVAAFNNTRAKCWQQNCLLLLCYLFLSFFRQNILNASISPEDMFSTCLLHSLWCLSFHCALYIIEAKLLKEVLDSVGSSLLVFINSCLTSGSVPAALKHAVVRGLLKEKHPLTHPHPLLTPLCCLILDLVVHLPFLSKLKVKVVQNVVDNCRYF